MPYCKHTYTYSHFKFKFTLSQFFCNLSIHTDTCHTAHIQTHMHISHLANFLPVPRRSRPAAQWPGGAWQELTGSDGRADSDNRAVTASAVAASRAGKFTAWKSEAPG